MHFERLPYYWWLVQLRAFLRLAPQIDDGLPTYMLVAGTASGVIVILTSFAQILLGFRPSAQIGLANVQLLFDAVNGLGAMVFIPTTIVVLAASHSGRRHKSLPAGLVWWGYLTALGCAISTLSIFSSSGFMAIGGIGTVVLGLLPFTVWVIWTSIVLIRVPRRV